MDKITEQDRAAIKTHLLTNQHVQTTLAGFLYQELRHIHNVHHVSPKDLFDALTKYVDAIKIVGDKAIGMVNSGVRARDR